jgi:hypothetical protein
LNRWKDPDTHLKAVGKGASAARPRRFNNL